MATREENQELKSLMTQLRQKLQNCGKSLKASDFKALLDFINQNNNYFQENIEKIFEYIEEILGKIFPFGTKTEDLKLKEQGKAGEKDEMSRIDHTHALPTIEAIGSELKTANIIGEGNIILTQNGRRVGSFGLNDTGSKTINFSNET
jgi:hypothetical protein